MRTLYCRWPECQIGYASVGGDLPILCPACGKASRWTTQMPFGAALPPAAEEPIPKYVITFNDARFLKSIRIDPELNPSTPT